MIKNMALLLKNQLRKFVADTKINFERKKLDTNASKIK